MKIVFFFLRAALPLAAAAQPTPGQAEFTGARPPSAPPRTAVALLNPNYGQARTSRPLEGRVQVRRFQGEFHTLRRAHTVQEKRE